jgi:Xaa-Pro aminopeptidase
MVHMDVDVLLLSVGPELPWLTGYTAMPLERLTMLVLAQQGDAVLLVPRLEAPRVVERPESFTLLPWDETDDPIELVARHTLPHLTLSSQAAGRVAIGDLTWARFVLDLRDRLPANVTLTRANTVVGPLRARKEPAEIETLRKAAACVDEIAAELQAGRIPLVGRTEAEISTDLRERMIEGGHRHANFAIVATADNAASPHHEPTDRVVRFGDVLLCDFGGTMDDPGGVGYCSDITRCVCLGEPLPEVRDAYDVLSQAHTAAVKAATVGTPCSEVDTAARRVIEDAGYGEYFIHRTGHGIGVEAHEDPYIVAGNEEPLAAGHTFSIEPGIYVPGRFGIRLEDIVVAGDDGPDSLNRADRSLVVL